MRKRVAGALLGLAAGAAAVATTVVCAGGALGWALIAAPSHRAGIPVRCSADAPPVPRRVPIRVLVWNVQFAAGREHRFFYDGGEAVSVDEATVRHTLDRIAEIIERVDPDVVLLQEVDRGSRRTARVDQHAALAQRLDFPCHASTPYYRSPYVPFPPEEHLGRMDMHLSVFSRYRIERGIRWQLPLLDESWLRQQYNLRRALMDVRLPIAEGGELRVYNTHLSAFSRGDGTLPDQVAVIGDQLTEATEDGAPWILAGDFNALPPGDDPARLGPDAALYAESVTPLQPLFEQFQSAVPAAAHARDPVPWRTWLPHDADRADRAIDHVFSGPGVQNHALAVLSDVVDASDHLPLLFTFEVQ